MDASAYLDDSTRYSIQCDSETTVENVQQATECTPLLRSNTNGNSVRPFLRQNSIAYFYHEGWFTIFCVSVLFIILLLGLVSGIYLLMVEDYLESRPSLSYTVIKRTNWGAVQPKRSVPSINPPFIEAVLTHTGSEECETQEHCKKLLRTLQDRQMNPHFYYDYFGDSNNKSNGTADIAYNFLVAANGDIYEGRGWDFQCELEEDDSIEYNNNNTLAVAFIGNYVNRPPSGMMFKVLQVLLEKAVDKDKLIPCYEVKISNDFSASFRQTFNKKSFFKNKRC